MRIQPVFDIALAHPYNSTGVSFMPNNVYATDIANAAEF